MSESKCFILSLVNTKGGTTKSTQVQCTAYSDTFAKAFKKIGIVELDPQGTLKNWHEERKIYKRQNGQVTFQQLLETDLQKIQYTLIELAEQHEILILDIPGESTGKLTTKLAMALSDLTLFPMRASTNDESSFESHILPLIEDIIEKDPGKKKSFHIIPTLFHPQTKAENLQAYFKEIMPETVGCFPVFMAFRNVFENFSREGMHLKEYAEYVKTNSKKYKQALKAIEDVEKIASEIYKLYNTQ